ncbi:MAG: 50S ribosomal protein L17 [Ignavibacteriales bacterium]|nr:50S ribosomal protein L17 [Ignavibacteriales bacterium]MCB9210015.1 50S ribosomal protein L17 [Ignavibacteriales bacterium]MCB9218600.1 50S ribosomal protein L17 [Ignavibacteriales bacterium]
MKGRKLGRTASHRTATLRSLATALIKHKKITTTLAKAKQTRLFVEPIITKAKNDTVHARRLIAKDIQDKDTLKELFAEVVPKIGDRPGGYTRVVKLGNRVGDAAEMAIIELVDYNDLAEKKASKPKKQTKAKTVKAAAAKVADVAEEVKDVVEESSNADDLSKVEGIGPKISELLQNAGITTFAQLAETEVEKLNEILAEAGGRYKSHDPSTWPQQAKLAADGKWDELKALQDELDGGREKK